MGLFDLFRRSPEPEETVEEGVWTAAASKDKSLSKEIEEAMSQAIKECMANDISLDETALIKKAMMQARARVLNKYR